MIHLKKRLAFGLAAGLLAACITVPVYGASRKKITSISLTIRRILRQIQIMAMRRLKLKAAAAVTM